MKKYLVFFGLTVLVSGLSCQKKEPAPGCLDCGKKVEEIQERPGRIAYDSAAVRYYVWMHVPGTIDSFRVGYVCELPEAYQEEGQQVVVSGTLYETSLRTTSAICCLDGFYCLALTSVRATY
ncbi:hypothetical protein GCM10027275_30420 [Rhabdobacter roseus]|uniref:Lipoprotein n=1 Tax=Rhabdobacter roseus TaxID=1655419 RepID=A0A840TZE2_9BACT|nr:hypothetical protein [Rhabdobacter roseus]MBB5284999.1 hypothetical protein [Rhabdobacter roseus]